MRHHPDENEKIRSTCIHQESRLSLCTQHSVSYIAGSKPNGAQKPLEFRPTPSLYKIHRFCTMNESHRHTHILYPTLYKLNPFTHLNFDLQTPNTIEMHFTSQIESIQ